MALARTFAWSPLIIIILTQIRHKSDNMSTREWKPTWNWKIYTTIWSHFRSGVCPCCNSGFCLATAFVRSGLANDRSLLFHSLHHRAVHGDAQIGTWSSLSPMKMLIQQFFTGEIWWVLLVQVHLIRSYFDRSRFFQDDRSRFFQDVRCEWEKIL